MEYKIVPGVSAEGFRNDTYIIPSSNLSYREVWPHVARLKDVMEFYPDSTFLLDITLFPLHQQKAFDMILALKNIKIV